MSEDEVKEDRFKIVGGCIKDTFSEKYFDSSADDLLRLLKLLNRQEHLIYRLNNKYIDKCSEYREAKLSFAECLLLKRIIYDFIRCGDESISDIKLAIELYEKVSKSIENIREENKVNRQ